MDPPPSKPMKPTPVAAYLKDVIKSKDGLKEITRTLGPKEDSALSILKAKECSEKDEKFFVYVIELKQFDGKSHTTTKRFNEFQEFHNEWTREYPSVQVEAPRKLLKATDEDVAWRCVELQTYLRELCAVSALIYWVAKFLKMEESALKYAIRGKSMTTEAVMATDSAATSRTSSRSLPRVTLQEFVSEAPPPQRIPSNGGAEEQTPPPKPAKPLPAIPVQEVAPIKVVDAPKAVTVKAAEASKPVPVKAAEAPKPVPVKVLKPEAVKAVVATAAASPAPVSKVVMAPQAPAAVKAEMGTTGLSVKERMAAFQKKA